MTTDPGYAVTAAAVRRLATPMTPPPGPLDGVIGLLLARAAPLDANAQSDLRRQQGWSHLPPQPIPEVRSNGRWQATAQLRRLTVTDPPGCVVAALQLLEELAPCSAGDAAAALMDTRLTDVPLHPGGVLSLARWYGLPTALRLRERSGGTDVVLPQDAALASELRRISITVGRAGYIRLSATSHHARRRDHAIDSEVRLRRVGDLVVRVDDRGSGLAGHVTRMLLHTPRPLTIDEIHGGLERHWRFRRGLLPDQTVLKAWLAAQPWLLTEDDSVMLSGDLNPRQLVTANSRGTAELVAQVAGGAVATWAQLVGALAATGMRRETAKMAVQTSVVLTHVGPDAYTLRGTTTDRPAVIHG